MSTQPTHRQMVIVAKASDYFEDGYEIIIKAFGWPERKVVRMKKYLNEHYYDCSGNGWAGSQHIDYIIIKFKIGQKTLYHNR
ncbi:MAG: hypothetical protein H0U60_19660 [Blastocatellia bacterium]|nr:hypothetical protein [Blastocatellia bacterium]